MKILLITILLAIFAYLQEASEYSSEVTNLVHCSTTKGGITLEIYREWSPLGADRFIELVRDGFFQDIAFFRCVDGFLTQFGISERPQYKHWHNKDIKDDPNLHKGIKKNFLSFAGGGPNTRSTQMFIAFEDLDFLGKEPWETPFGMVIEGQATLDSLYKGYGDIPPFGKGPNQQKIHNRGNKYLQQEFPLVDYINSCHVIEEPTLPPAEPVAESRDAPAEDKAVQESVQAAQSEGGLRKGAALAAKQGDDQVLAAVEAEVEVDAEVDAVMKRRMVQVFIFVAGLVVAIIFTIYLQSRLKALSKRSL